MRPSADFGLERITQIAIRVRDLSRAVAFYRDVLGLTLVTQAPSGLAFLRCGDVTLMLSRPEKPEFDHPASLVYYAVDDIDAAYRALAARGVKFVAPPHRVHRAAGYELWMAFFHDVDENPLALSQHKPLVA